MKNTMMIIDGNNWFRLKAETDMFGNPLRSCYNDLQMRHEDVVLLVWDGQNGLAKRRAIYPEYKRGRKFAGESFYEIQTTFKDVARLSKAITVEVPGFEADDVIAHFVRRYRDEFEIKIDSNDADFYQLGVTLTRAKPAKFEPAWTVLYKTLVGDPSDNIKGVAGFGQKSWDSLTNEDRKALEVFVSSLIDGISFDNCHLPVKHCFPQRCLTWLQNPDNAVSIAVANQIVNFLPVPDDLIDDGCHVGGNRPAEADALLKRYFS